MEIDLKKIYFGKTVEEHIKRLRTLIFHRMYGLAHGKPFRTKDELAIFIKDFYNDETGIPELVDYYAILYDLQ